jgi:hypothetical protein
VLQLVLAGLQSGQWGRKKAAATAISQICQTSGDALASHAPALLDALLKASAGCFFCRWLAGCSTRRCYSCGSHMLILLCGWCGPCSAWLS